MSKSESRKNIRRKATARVWIVDIQGKKNETNNAIFLRWTSLDQLTQLYIA